MTLEQFVTKDTLLVDEARYTSEQKDRMVHDTLISGISNDAVCGKIIKKGPNVTLAQHLETSRLEKATQQSLSQMSNTKPLVNYVLYDKKKKKNKVKSLQNNKLWGNSMELDLCLQTTNQMLMENSRPKVKSVTDVKKADINQIRNVVPFMLSVTNVDRKDILL